MKTPALVFAAILAMSSAAFAGDVVVIKHAEKQKIERNVELDYRPTGSVQRTVQPEAALDHAGKQTLTNGDKRLGIDVNPWMMPAF